MPSNQEMAKIALAVCADYYRLDREDIVSGSRKMRVAWPRNMAMTLVWSKAGLKQEDTAKIFNCKACSISSASNTMLTRRRMDHKTQREWDILCADFDMRCNQSASNLLKAA